MTHGAEAEEERAQLISVFQAWWATHASVQETSMRYGHPLGFLPGLGVQSPTWQRGPPCRWQVGASTWGS